MLVVYSPQHGRRPRAVVHLSQEGRTMQTNPSSDPGRSPVPGVIPEPVRVEEDTGTRHARTPSHGLFHRFLAALRGDRYMVDAYPPDWHSPIVGGDQGAETTDRPASARKTGGEPEEDGAGGPGVQSESMAV